MVTIVPHTTRATGTVLTAAIYNADHQNHITNATTINATAAWTNLANTFAVAQTMVELLISGGLGIHRDVSNSLLVLAGGTSGSPGANIELYGGTHSTTANDAFIDADEINFRSANGSGTTNATINGNLTVTGTLTGAAAAFPTGTVMLFQQTAAPLGWTKLAVHNNKALRLTTGSVTTGGSVAFTTAFASQANTGTIGGTVPSGSISNTTAGGTVGNTALSADQLPAHTHDTTISGSTSTTGDHSHTVQTRNDASGGTGEIGLTNPGATGTKSTNTTGNHSHTFSGSGTSNGGNGLFGNAHGHSFTGSSHGHTFTGNSHNHSYTGDAINLAVQYVDVIMASKD